MIEPASESALAEQERHLHLAEAAELSEPQRRPHVLRRLIGQALVAGLVVGPVASAVNMFRSPARAVIGPAEADVTLATDGQITHDLSWVGSLDLPASGTYGLGVDITYREIPIKPANVNKPQLTKEEIESVVRGFGDPDRIKAEVKDALAKKFADGALTFGVLGVGVYAAGYAVLGERRRKELASSVKSRPALLAAAMAGLLSLSPAQHLSAADTEASPVSASFNGTALEGGMIRGRLMQALVNDYAVTGLRYWEEDREFYEDVATNLRQAYQQTTPLMEDENSTTILFEEGLGCNIGMAKVIGQAVKLYKPTLMVSAGDYSAGPSFVQSECIASLDYHTRGTKQVVAPGNHDPEAAQAEAADRGFTVLDGKIVSVGGLRILGDDDPNASLFGNPKRPRRQETTHQMGHRLSDEACQDEEGVDLYVVNEPNAAREVAARGCARLVLTGGLHGHDIYQTASQAGNLTPTYIIDRSGGATPLGPLQKPAHLGIIKIDKSTQAMSYQTIEVATDKTVHISPPQNFSQAPIRG